MQQERSYSRHLKLDRFHPMPHAFFTKKQPTTIVSSSSIAPQLDSKKLQKKQKQNVVAHETPPRSSPFVYNKVVPTHDCPSNPPTTLSSTETQDLMKP